MTINQLLALKPGDKIRVPAWFNAVRVVLDHYDKPLMNYKYDRYEPVIRLVGGAVLFAEYVEHVG